jgi:urease accessory protein
MRPAADMLRLEHIIGLASEPEFAELLHRLDHEGVVEYLTLTQADTQRHRLRVLTDRGTECAIALPRTAHLSNGAVLLLEEHRAVVVRMQETQWLRLQARDAQAALQLGYFAGNMHWKVEFDGTTLRVALQGPAEGYLERLAPLLQDGRVVHET